MEKEHLKESARLILMTKIPTAFFDIVENANRYGKGVVKVASFFTSVYNQAYTTELARQEGEGRDELKAESGSTAGTEKVKPPVMPSQEDVRDAASLMLKLNSLTLFGIGSLPNLGRLLNCYDTSIGNGAAFQGHKDVDGLDAEGRFYYCITKAYGEAAIQQASDDTAVYPDELTRILTDDRDKQSSSQGNQSQWLISSLGLNSIGELVFCLRLLLTLI
jgi:hypothetical protein